MTTPDVRTPGEVGTDSRALREADAAILDDAAQIDKRQATLQARLALRAVVLQRLPGGEYLAHSRGAFTTLADLQAVEQFAGKVGA